VPRQFIGVAKDGALGHVLLPPSPGACACKMQRILTMALCAWSCPEH